MADAVRAKSKLLLVKMEADYGVDPTPDGANAILATNFELSPMEGEDVSRELEYPWLGAQEVLHGGLRGVMSFSTELVPAGDTGVAPAWGPLARACAMAEVVTPDDDPGDGTVVYTPVTEDHESVAIYFYIGPTRFIFLGARGTATLTVNAQGIPRFRWTLTGLWSLPTDQAAVTPDYSGFQDPVLATSTNTPTFEINSVALVLRTLTFNLGNQVEPRFLVGKDEILITDRTEQIEATVEATPLDTFSPFALAQARTKVAVDLVHGAAAGFITTISAPTCQLGRPGAHAEQQGIVEWPLSLTPLPADGNDEFSITLT